MAPKPFESRIQDLVYNVDVGIGLRLIKFGLYLLMVLGVMLIYTATQFHGLRDAEAMEYAQLGRNLMQRGEYVTQCIRPLSMWCMIEKSPHHDPMIEGHPDILHPPLYPALLAAGFKAAPATFSAESGAGAYAPEQWIIVPLGHLFTLMTAVLVFLLGKQLFDHKVAWLGVTLYVLSDVVWRNSISGLNISMVMFLATLAFYTALLAANMREGRSEGMMWIVPFSVSALAVLAAFLTRYGAVVLVPGIALFIAVSFRKKGWLWAFIFVVVFLVGITPWLIRNKMVSGGLLGLAPYMALVDSQAFAGDTLERTLAPTFGFSKVVPALQAKWMTNIASISANQVLTLGDGLLICLFISTFFYRFMRRPVHLFRWGVALSVILLVGLAALFGGTTVRLLEIFWPIVILYGLAFFFLLLDRLQLKVRILNMGVTALLGLLCAMPLLFSLLPPRAGVPYPPYFPPFIVHVCNLLEPHELLCTDMPWATAWYGRRDSLQLPVTIDEFYEINDYNKRVSGIYFTTLTRNQPYVRSLVTGNYRTWMPILEGRIPGDFPLTQGFPLSNLDQLFLTDRARWAE